MVENIEKLLDRDEKLSIIATKSNNLNERSKNVNYMVAKIKKQEKMKQHKTMLMIGGGVAVRNSLIKIRFCYFCYLL